MDALCPHLPIYKKLFIYIFYLLNQLNPIHIINTYTKYN